MSEWPLPDVDPKENGFDPDRLERITRLVGGYIDKEYAAGAIAAVVRNFGMQHREKKQPMADDTIFRLYSMSKPVTAVAVLMLYEEGYYFLDEPVKRFMPVLGAARVKVEKPDGTSGLLPLVRDITILDLLNHTSGITYEGFHEAEKDGSTLEQFVSRYDTIPLLHQPRTQWHYGASSDVLGYLVELVSGMPYDEFLQERIFSPLGMTDTGFWVPQEKQDRFGIRYKQTADRKLLPMNEEDREYFVRPALPSGGGGLVGTASDYLRFCQMLLNNGEFDGTRILGRKTVELMRQDHLPPGHGPIMPFRFGYGLGVSVIRSLAEKQGICSVGEFNWGGAASTDIWIDPAENMVTMIMMQLRPNFTQMLTKKVHDAAYQALV